jgi:hypothetical protein
MSETTRTTERVLQDANIMHDELMRAIELTPEQLAEAEQQATIVALGQVVPSGDLVNPRTAAKLATAELLKVSRARLRAHEAEERAASAEARAVAAETRAAAAETRVAAAEKKLSALRASLN